MTHDFPHNSPAPTPSRANYGFALYLASSTGFIVYCLWGLDLEGKVFSALSITYLPQVYWAVAIPIHLMVTLAFVGFVLYPALNLLSNRPFREDVHIECGLPEDPGQRMVPRLEPISMVEVSRRLYLEQ